QTTTRRTLLLPPHHVAGRALRHLHRLRAPDAVGPLELHHVTAERERPVEDRRVIEERPVDQDPAVVGVRADADAAELRRRDICRGAGPDLDGDVGPHGVLDGDQRQDLPACGQRDLRRGLAAGEQLAAPEHVQGIRGEDIDPTLGNGGRGRRGRRGGRSGGQGRATGGGGHGRGGRGGGRRRAGGRRGAGA